MSPVANIVRENRRKFLHKRAWSKFKGYSFSQLAKSKHNKTETSKRRAQFEKYGFDLKFASHVLRLLLEVEQILIEGDLDLTRHSEVLKSVRRGEWTFERVQQWFNDKERQLEETYAKSELPWGPNEEYIKSVLLNCLEQHYGSLDKCVANLDKYEIAIREIQEIVGKL